MSVVPLADDVSLATKKYSTATNLINFRPAIIAVLKSSDKNNDEFSLICSVNFRIIGESSSLLVVK